MNDSGFLLQSPAGAQWKKIGVQQYHGVVLPLFSLHSSQSCGIGEFPDLLTMITWCRDIGLNVIQLLPLNDTGNDSSPYSAISAFALNPIHLGLAQLPYINQSSSLISMLPAMQQMSSCQRVDYAKVHVRKRQFLQEYFRVIGPQMTATPEYHEFLQQNSWLQEYALFKVLKIEHNWQSWELWEDDIRNVTPESFQNLQKKYESEIAFHIFLQFLCFQQLRIVKKFAEDHEVFLKGDIPILISRESADVWYHRTLFRMQFSAGSPPDMYSSEGQNWGFPIYDWDAMEQDGYRWWKQRLAVASQFYHLYRIDHIVGFFRIWSIPEEQTGSHGKFIPENSAVWIDHGEKCLRMMLANCSMLPIGEDLGVVPPEVRKSLHSLGICGTKVMRWERMWNEDGRFIPFHEYMHASMTTVSTHDSETLQLWWENSPKEAHEFADFKGWGYSIELSKPHHQEILRDSHHTNSLFHINLLQEYLALIPGMTWPNPDDERINVPGVISDHNWTYRFRPSVEEIAVNIPLRQVMQEILSISKQLCLVFMLFFGFFAMPASTSALETIPQASISAAKLHVLYESLDPLSIAQHLAFYDLYPDTSEGKLALSQAWTLLNGKGSNSAQDLNAIPLLNVTLPAIIGLVNKQPDAPCLELSDEDLSLIERLASSLSNRSLKGHQAKSEADVILLPSSEIDLSRGLLLTELGDNLAKIRSYEALIDLMALQIRSKLPEEATSQAKIRIINDFIFGEMGFRFPPHSCHAKDIDIYTFLPSVLDSRRGVCLGVSILYICLAQRLNLNLEMITPPGHIYVRYRDGDVEINIETTARGMHIGSEEYLSIDTCALQQRNVKEVIGLAHINHAYVFGKDEDYESMLTCYQKAKKYVPEDKLLMELMGYTYLCLGKTEEAIALLKEVQHHIPSHAITGRTTAEDYLIGAVDAESIQGLFKEVDETRASLLEKRQMLENAVKKYPQFRAGWFNLASTWLQLHREREALDALQHYHSLYDNDPTAEFYLSMLYAKRSDYNKAWEHLHQVEEIVKKKDYMALQLKELRNELARISPE
jgi:4-alpha-glucanotransferase